MEKIAAGEKLKSSKLVERRGQRSGFRVQGSEFRV
jgi:hypothetical protein